jgi:hypothetical protein
MGHGVGAGTLACIEIRSTVFQAQLNKRSRTMLMNLIIGLPIMLLCLALQAVVTFGSIRFYIGQSGRMRPGGGLFAQVRPLLIVMIAMMLGNFVQIVIWGALFIFLGEFSMFYEAVYHSAVNFTSLGYGDVVMSARWKLMGPLEAANGILMLGMTSATLVAIIQHLIKAHSEIGPDQR